MPNYCFATMRIRGRSDCVDEFINIMDANYNYGDKNYNWNPDLKNFSHIPHFYRVFELLYTNCNDITGIYKYAEIGFDCAWSVWTCLFDGPYTYYNDMHKNHPTHELYDTHILNESKRLKLEIEIWSQEPGMGFQEHYKICSGVLIVNEEFNYSEINLDMTYNEFMECYQDYAEENNINTEEDFNKLYNENSDGYIIAEGHDEEYSFDEHSKPKYLGNIIMC